MDKRSILNALSQVGPLPVQFPVAVHETLNCPTFLTYPSAHTKLTIPPYRRESIVMIECGGLMGTRQDIAVESTFSLNAVVRC